MKAFSALIDLLIYTRSRNIKLQLIADYLRETPDPDRGYALAALTEALDFPAVKSAMVRKLAMTRIDEELLRLSRQFVGDTSETVALLWESPNDLASADVGICEAVDLLSGTSRTTAPAVLEKLLDRLDGNERYALLKIALGGMRIGVSARLAKQAFAKAFDVSVDDVEELWHALQPPYTELFAWAEGRAEKPDLSLTPFFRPFMLAHPLEAQELDLAEFAAEWKWDGIRAQVAHGKDANGRAQTRIYSRGGEEISRSFPEILNAFNHHAVIDGELLVRGESQGGEAASFNALQQRLGRKNVSKKMLVEAPAFVRVYDLLACDGDDLRPLPWEQRRSHLEAFMAQLPDTHFDISPLIEADDFAGLSKLREGTRDSAIEGIMLKRRDSAYQSGRKAGEWYKWKRDPLIADCVMMYAQRGNGRRASFFSDYTFGCWNEEGELLPVGKAYSGFTDEELKMLDRFVRQNTINRFGPVREVEKQLVLEVAFDSIHESKRHKSGLAMRFPRISRIRTDKPAEEADMLTSLQAMVT